MSRLTLQRDSWAIIDPYKREFPIDSIQIRSYNDFLENRARKVIQENAKLTAHHNKTTYKVDFYNVNYVLPYHVESDDMRRNIFPVEACERSITYSTDVLVSMRVITIENDTGNESEQVFENVCIGKFPVMVGSALCNLTHIQNDPTDIKKTRECQSGIGGYFIINGNKKCVVSQERSSFNRICLFVNRNDNPKYTHYAQVRNSATSSSHTTTTNVGILKDKKIYVSVPSIQGDSPIPIIILFKALGVVKEKEIMDCIVSEDDELRKSIIDIFLPSFEYAYPCRTTNQALTYIGKKAKKYTSADKDDSSEKAIGYAMYLLKNEVFPQYGSNFVEKRYYLGFMVQSMLHLYLGKKKPEDRDLYSKKRVDTVGTLLSNLLYGGVKKAMGALNKAIETNIKKRAKFKFQNHVSPKIVTKEFQSALSSGNWGGRTNKSKKTGISQNYEQFNYMMRIININKLSAPISVEGRVTDPRRLHDSHYGIICPSDTPEGENVGLKKVFALLSYVTLFKDPTPIIELLEEFDIVKLENFVNDNNVLGMCKILVNGKWIGSTHDPKHIYDSFRQMKLKCDIEYDTGIVYDTTLGEIRISTDDGRLCRPYLLIEDGELKLKRENVEEIFEKNFEWSDIVAKGYVEMIDPDEYEYIYLCESLNAYYDKPDREYTHCDIHPATILGIGATTVPKVESNQAPRNSYQCNMCKQAVGVPYTNYRSMLCGTCHILNYVQKPLVSSSMARRILKYDEQPSGVNAIVAIAPLSGFNQEDSNVINKASLDRGLFRSSKFVTYTEKIQKHKDEFFGIATREECEMFRGGNPRFVDSDFCVSVGAFVQKGDVLVGKLKKINYPNKDKEDNERKKKFIDLSLILRDCEMAQVTAVRRGRDAKNFEYISVQICEQRIPEAGDKFASTIAQKNTVGIIMNQVDLPFSPDPFGAPVPDIILNPLCFPSRMTIGQLIEALIGKKCASANKKLFLKNEGKGGYSKDHCRGDCTSFEQFNVEDLNNELKEMGYHPCGNTVMIDGASGMQLETLIFMCPTYVQRLKHMVQDKYHARARGPRQVLSRQPTEGRGRSGGLKLGEMERDSLISQGAPYVLKDRLADQSDAIDAFVCKFCGLFAVANHKNRRYECTSCETEEVYKIKTVNGMKIVIQELMAMNIVPRILVDPKTGEFKMFKT